MSHKFILGALLIVVILSLLFRPQVSALFYDWQSSLKKVELQKNQDLEAFWLPIIGERLKQVGVRELKNEVIPDGAKEIRIWVGFSQNGFRGLIIKDHITSWSASYIPNFDRILPSSGVVRSLSTPKSGWQELLAKLQEIGLYDLIDEPDNEAGRLSLYDAISAIVEIKTSSSYRVYKYRGLLYYRTEEAKKMEKIIETLSSEFEVQLWS